MLRVRVPDRTSNLCGYAGPSLGTTFMRLSAKCVPTSTIYDFIANVVFGDEMVDRDADADSDGDDDAPTGFV